MQWFSVFSHLSAAKAGEYRAALDAFAAARREFVIHLRPAEVAQAIWLSAEEVEPILDQLVEWGNLSRSRDDFEAVSIEDFYRTKWLYQLSAEGEAAEQALALFQESLHQPGELQRNALRDIIDYLEAIRRMLAGDAAPHTTDHGKLLQQFTHLNARFEEFTVQSQRFMHFLQNTIELHGLSTEAFIAYKDRLIEYLQRFVGELIASVNEIEQKVVALEQAGVRGFFQGIAGQARIDALDADDPEKLVAEKSRWEGRWNGLRRWFLGDAASRPQAEMLRARAREAIPALLVALQNMHDRRQTGSDRFRDWRRLAHWFAEMPDDAAAHQLWRVAFALGPSRHLRINEETLAYRDQAQEDARTSWLEAEPVWLDPQLRKTGRQHRTSFEPAMVDLSKEREALRLLSLAENEQLVCAHEALGTGETMWLSDFAELEPATFDLLLDLLSGMISGAIDRDDDTGPIVTTSTDGTLTIELDVAHSRDRMACIRTPHGTLTGPDYRITIRPTESEPEPTWTG